MKHHQSLQSGSEVKSCLRESSGYIFDLSRLHSQAITEALSPLFDPALECSPLRGQCDFTNTLGIDSDRLKPFFF